MSPQSLNEERRAERWRAMAESLDGPWVAGWQNPRRTKALVICYFAGLGLAVLALIGTSLSTHAIWAYVAALVLAATAWTVLRSTIQLKDSAPETVLDEYERAVLSTWRRRSALLSENLLYVGGACLIAIGLLWGEALGVVTIALIGGCGMILIAMVAGSLPAVGYALTFNRDPEATP